jgi:hypothetical protein
MGSRWFDDLSEDRRKARLVRVEQQDNDLVLEHRWGSSSSSRAEGGFLFLFLLGWTTGCVLGIRHLIDQPNLRFTLFAIPFLAVGMFVFGELCGIIFGCSSLRIGSNGATLTRRVLPLRRKRHVPLDEIKGVTQYSAQIAMGRSGSSRTEFGLMIVTIGEPLRFAQGVEPAEIARLIELLEQHRQAFTRRLYPGDRSTRPTVKRWDQPFPERTAVAPPSDSEIELVPDQDGMVFRRRYPLHLANLGITTYMNLFCWNGIVGVVVWFRIQKYHWSLFFFLIPLEVVGVYFLLDWLAALTSPWWRQEWAFGADRITRRFSIFGLGRTWDYDLQQFASVEIRKAGTVKKKPFSLRSTAEKVDRPFSLGLVSDGGADFLVVDELTEGEARWMESELRVLLELRPLKMSSRLVPVPDVTDTVLWDRELDG